MSRSIMRLLMLFAPVCGLAASGAAQNVAVVGQSARLVRSSFCLDRGADYYCPLVPVRGTITRISPDTIVVNIGRPRLSVLDRVVTGRYADSLIHWTASSQLLLEVRTGRRTRFEGGIRHAEALGLVGAAVGLAGGAFVVVVCATWQPCSVGEAALLAPIVIVASGVAGGAVGFVAGFAMSRIRGAGSGRGQCFSG